MTKPPADGDGDGDTMKDDGCVFEPPCGFEVCNTKDDYCEGQIGEGCPRARHRLTERY